MAKSDEERGERKPYSERYRLGVGDCTGWDTSLDPSTLPKTRLTKIENARIIDGIVACRGGQSKANSGGALSGCVFGMIDVEGTTKFLMESIAADGSEIFDVFTMSPTPTLTRIAEGGTVVDLFDQAQPRYVFGRLGTFLVRANGTKLYKLVIPEGDPDPAHMTQQEWTDIGHTIASLHTIPGFPDLLYLGTTDSKVFTFDGTTLTEMSPSGPSSRLILGSLGGILHAASTGDIQRFVNGAWEVLTIPGTVTSFGPVCVLEANSLLYFGGFDGTITGNIETVGGVLLEVDSSGTVTVSLSGAGDYAVTGLAIANQEVYSMVSYNVGSGIEGSKIIRVSDGSLFAALTGSENNHYSCDLAGIGSELWGGFGRFEVVPVDTFSGLMGFVVAEDGTEAGTIATIDTSEASYTYHHQSTAIHIFPF